MTRNRKPAWEREFDRRTRDTALHGLLLVLMAASVALLVAVSLGAV